MKKRKFELIKKYPGLHEDVELGAIATTYFDTSKYDYYSEFDCYTNIRDYKVELENKEYLIFFPSDIEDHPEFWRELEYVITTVDGVDLYEKDNYYVYNLDLALLESGDITIEEKKAISPIRTPSMLNMRRFSTYEAAKQDLENMLSTKADRKEDEEGKKEYTKEDLRTMVKFVAEVMCVGDVTGAPIKVPLDESTVDIFVDNYDEFKIAKRR